MAVVEGTDMLSGDLADRALELLRVDTLGLDEADRRYLRALAHHYKGGPVGPKSLSASTGLDMATIEQTIEPWLMRAGLLIRTRKGRAITDAGRVHLGVPPETL